MDHPLFLALVVGSLTLFACVVGYASHQETMAWRRAEKSRKEAQNASSANPGRTLAKAHR